MEKGKLIVIEGTDCSGKETQSKLLEEKLNEVIESFISYVPNLEISENYKEFINVSEISDILMNHSKNDIKVLLKNKKYFIRTYGCQGNLRDSEVIAGILEKIGYVATDSVDNADIIVLNTLFVPFSFSSGVLIMHRVSSPFFILFFLLVLCLLGHRFFPLHNEVFF